ncbi:BOS complex subunit NCLN-like isoform X2 [Glandiceps talaboti]
MLFDEANEVFEMFKGSFPLSFLFFVPVLILISPCVPVVDAAHEFTVFRMQQYDLHGSPYGCRNALVNMEARPIDSSVATRRCIITRLTDLSIERYRELLEQAAGALLVLIPPSLNSISQEELENWLEMEPQLLAEQTNVPIYFAYEDEKLLEIYDSIQSAVNSDQAASATEALLSAVYANGFQMVVNGPQAKVVKDMPIFSIQGKLSGLGIEDQLPTIAIVTHYDTFGVAPHLSFGADSNGSGVVALLELSRLFSKLYTSSRTHAKFNLLFLLSGGGKFNYQGTKKWIEDNVETADSSLLSDVSYVLCLDSIGSGDSIFVHVSKPPKEGSVPYAVIEEIKSVASALYPSVNFTMVHKKINLADDLLAWEHERFSIKRLPAGTLSHLQSHKSLHRNTIADDRSSVDVDKLCRNIKIIGEAIARYIYNINDGNQTDEVHVFTDALAVNRDFVASWLDYIVSFPRAAPLINKDHHLLQTLEQGMSRYLKEVRKFTVKADKRDPEFAFYDGLAFTMFAYNVKPAVFDLFLAFGIAAYLALVYLAVTNFSFLYDTLKNMSRTAKVKEQ